MDRAYSETGTKKANNCNFCMKALGREYYYTCHMCGATYCYIHTPKHARAHKATMPVAIGR